MHNVVYIGKKSQPPSPTFWYTRKTSTADSANGPVVDIDSLNEVQNDFSTDYRILGTPPVTVTLNGGGLDRVICAWNNKITVLNDDGSNITNTTWEDNDILGAPLAYHSIIKISTTEAVYVAYGRENPDIGGSIIYAKARKVTLSGGTMIFGPTITLAKPTWSTDGQIAPSSVIAGKLNVEFIGQSGVSNYYLFAWDSVGFEYNAQIIKDIESSSWVAGPSQNGLSIFGTSMKNTGINEKGEIDLTFHTIAKNGSNNTWMQYVVVDPVTLNMTPTGPNLDLETMIGSPTTTVLQGFAFEMRKTALLRSSRFFFLTGWNVQEWIMTHDSTSGYSIKRNNGSNPTMNATIFNETASGPAVQTFVSGGAGNGRTHIYMDDPISGRQTMVIFSIGISQANRYIISNNKFQQRASVNEDSSGQILSDRNSSGTRGINIFDTSYQIIRVTSEKLYIIYTKGIASTTTIGIRGKVVNRG